MHKQNVVYPYTEMLFCNTKEMKYTVQRAIPSMDESQNIMLSERVLSQMNQ